MLTHEAIYHITAAQLGLLFDSILLCHNKTIIDKITKHILLNAEKFLKLYW